MKPYMVVTQDFTEDLSNIIKKFKRDAVLVGIPESDSERKDGDANNAAILALNNFGSPANNIPPRPVMEIGIRQAQGEIVAAFKKGAVDALSGGSKALSPAYNRAGIIASTSIKKVINSQEGIAPPSEFTLRLRRAAGFKGEKALLVTGQMRNAITYVVKGED